MDKHKVYLLESKYHGSNQQLKSVAKEIFGYHEIVPLEVELRSRSKIFQPIYWLALEFLRCISPYGLVSHCIKRLLLKGYDCSSHELYEGDVILSKTPPFEYPSAILKAGGNAKSYHIGEPRRVKRKCFDYVISTPSSPTEKPDISLDVLPTEMSFENFIKIRDAYSCRKYYLMLIGGAARGFNYKKSDWEYLIDFIKEHDEVDWVVSTSPRTGNKVEMFIKERLEGSLHVKELVLWGMGKRKNIFDCLSGAEVVLVTEDSASMLSDAINCRIPTVSIRPSRSEFNNLTTPFARFHEERKRIVRVETSRISNFPVKYWAHHEFRPIEYCWTESWRT